MAFRRFKGRKYRRKARKGGKRWGKRFSRRFTNYRKMAKISRKGNWVIPNSIMMKDFYQDALTDTTGAPGISDTITYTSSVFDPNNSGVGTTSLYYNEMAGMYNKFRVYGMKIQYKIFNLSDDVSKVVSVFDRSNVAVAGALCSEASTWARAKSRLLGPKGSSSDTAYITHYAKVKDLWDNKDLKDDITFAGTIGNNPSSLIYSHLLQTNMAGNALNTFTESKVTYYVEWFDRVRPDYNA